jgi:hypothetical protein
LLFLTALPASLNHAGNLTGEGELPETDPAQLKLPKESARAAATETTVAMAAGELRRPGGLLGG